MVRQYYIQGLFVRHVSSTLHMTNRETLIDNKVIIDRAGME